MHTHMHTFSLAHTLHTFTCTCEHTWLLLSYHSLQELAGLRKEVTTVVDNIKAELDFVIQQKSTEIAQLEVCQVL